MSYREAFESWLKSPKISSEEHKELISIAENDKEIESRFFAPLEFGTAGLRGVMGSGIYRMNAHVVRQATQGLANVVLENGGAERGVAIAYDSRHRSEEFAREAACVLAANGIKVYLYDALRPTPELSFAVREYGCIAGINITASHNPKEYNGYKVYWEDGAQLPPTQADAVAGYINSIDMWTGVKTMDYQTALSGGRIELLGAHTDKEFLDNVLCNSINRDAVAKVADSFTIIYTPFHGTGYKLVPEALHRLGFKNVICEPEQMKIDGSFPTVVSPNPENKEGFERAISLAKKHDATLIIGTDPDADRVGIVLRDNKGEYVTLSGNQVGVLLLDYIIRARREKGSLPKNPAAIKTIVTTEMARAVGEKQGVAVFDCFTGFKFIAELIAKFEASGSNRYIFGFEESYGYLVGDHCRDKDAVTASMLIAEMAAWYAVRGKTLFDAMQELYETYGCYREITISLSFPGLDGLTHMADMMQGLRNAPPSEMGGILTVAMRDYNVGERYDLASGNISRLDLKGSNVLYFEMLDGSTFIVRPSGTEPKVKVYIMTCGKTMAECDRKAAVYTAWAKENIK